MLILGNLAAIALPAFYNQKTKANDAKAKVIAHAAQVAMETCATGRPTAPTRPATPCRAARDRAVDPAVGTVRRNPGRRRLHDHGHGGRRQHLLGRPRANGTITYPCTVSASNRGGCPGTGIAAGTWG